MFGGGEGEPPYGLTPMESEPAKIETTPQFLPPSRWHLPLQGLEAPTFDVSDNSLDEKTLHAKT